jgi:hypothetical protein
MNCVPRSGSEIDYLQGSLDTYCYSGIWNTNQGKYKSIGRQWYYERRYSTQNDRNGQRLDLIIWSYSRGEVNGVSAVLVVPMEESELIDSDSVLSGEDWELELVLLVGLRRPPSERL